jgi:hypothetical protein
LDHVVVNIGSYMTDFHEHLLPLIRPTWKGVELGSKVFDSGITNFLVAVFEAAKGLKGSGEDVVLVRINGTGSEKVINRTDELECVMTINKAGLCPPIYAKLRNGLCYGFCPGRQVGMTEVREEEISTKIACLLARLHAVEIPQHFQGREPQLWAKVGWEWGMGRE